MKKKKILFASSVHRFNDIRIYHKEILSLHNDYNIDLIATKSNSLRNDNLTIESHLRQLNESDFLNLYKEITKSIRSNEL